MASTPAYGSVSASSNVQQAAPNRFLATDLHMIQQRPAGTAQCQLLQAHTLRRDADHGLGWQRQGTVPQRDVWGADTQHALALGRQVPTQSGPPKVNHSAWLGTAEQLGKLLQRRPLGQRDSDRRQRVASISLRGKQPVRLHSKYMASVVVLCGCQVPFLCSSVWTRPV